jgi:hypothetical protein
MKQIKIFVLSAIIVQTAQLVILLSWLSIGKSAIYGTNDDSLISSISSGQLTGAPDPHLIFIQPLISYPIAWLETILTSYSGYSIFLIMVTTFSYTLIFSLLISSRRLNIINTTFWFLSNLIFQSWYSLNPTYTGASLFAAGAASGFILFYILRQEEQPKYFIKFILIISSLLTFLCFGIRKEGIYILLILVIPVILLNTKNLLRDKKNLLYFILPFIGLLIANSAISQSMYKNANWEEFTNMNNLRHQIQLRSPEVEIVNKLDQLGWTKETYVMFTRFSLLDNKQMNSEKMQMILTLTNKSIGPRSLFSTNPEAIFKLVKEAFNPWTWIIKYIALILLFAGLINYHQSNLKKYLLQNVSLFGSSVFLIVVLASGYQIPERISLNLLAAISLALFATTMQTNNIKTRIPRILNIVLIIAMIFLTRDTFNRFTVELHAREGLYKTRQAYAIQQGNSLAEQGNSTIISNASGLKSHWRYPYSSWTTFDSRNKTIILGWQNLSPISQIQFNEQGLKIEDFPKKFIDSNILWVDSLDSINETTKFLNQYTKSKIQYVDMGPVGNDEYHYFQFVTSQNL